MLDVTNVKLQPGDIVRVIGSPWGIADMERYVGTLQEIDHFYCWNGKIEHYVLKDAHGWIWAEQYLRLISRNELNIEIDEVMNLLKE